MIQLAPEWTLSLYSIKKEVLSAMIAVVTTLMGFLAAFVTLFFGLRGSKFFLKYEKAGYLEIFKAYYMFTLVFSLFCVFLALVAMGENSQAWLFRMAVFFFMNSTFYVLASAYAIMNVASKSGLS